MKTSFAPTIYQQRRKSLSEKLKTGMYLFYGNCESPINYADNSYRFRQDSTFLYYFGISRPGLAAIIDLDHNKEILFGTEATIDDLIWSGEFRPLRELAELAGLTSTAAISGIDKYLSTHTHILPPYRPEHKSITQSFSELKPSLIFIQAIIEQRSVKEKIEINEMHKACDIAKLMHIEACKVTKKNEYEYQVLAAVEYIQKKYNTESPYPIILTTEGNILHNHAHHRKLESGKLILNDSGAELPNGYCSDITRTFPVSGKFSEQQKNIYLIVNQMTETAKNKIQPDVFYQDIHTHVNRTLIESLKELDILNGNIDDMLEIGLGGLFMPHGLGHMIGLDVHDMENLGETWVGYEPNQQRSTLPGLKSLRLARRLKEDFTLTVEPGCYFIPTLIETYKKNSIFNSFINYPELEKYYTFGGIRIEENVRVTTKGYELLGSPIPKSVEEIELIMT